MSRAPHNPPLDAVCAAVEQHGVRDWTRIGASLDIAPVQAAVLYCRAKKDFDRSDPTREERRFLVTHFGVPSPRYGENGCTLLNFIEEFPTRSYEWITANYKRILQNARCPLADIRKRRHNSQYKSRTPRRQRRRTAPPSADDNPGSETESDSDNDDVCTKLPTTLAAFSAILCQEDGDDGEAEKNTSPLSLLTAQDRAAIETEMRENISTMALSRSTDDADADRADMIDCARANLRVSDSPWMAQRAREMMQQWQDYVSAWTAVRECILGEDRVFAAHIEYEIGRRFSKVRETIFNNRALFANNDVLVNAALSHHRARIEKEVRLQFSTSNKTTNAG